MRPGQHTYFGPESEKRIELSPATVYRLCADGQIPHVRILNSIRIVPADLAAFVAARRGPK